MSGIGDAMTALKNVLLMQERIQGLKAEIERVSQGVSGLSDYCVALDKRILRIETMIEMSARPGPPRIDG